MKTLTVMESADWCRAHGIELDDRKKPKSSGKGIENLRFLVPQSLNKLVWFCRYVEEIFQPRDRCLLWVTSWGIWESSENWHLYYRLRQSYQDTRLLDEAPGHLFLSYEANDLTSFLQVGLTAGWDMHLLPSSGYGQAFISHDGWIEFAMADPVELNNIKNKLVEMISSP